MAKESTALLLGAGASLASCYKLPTMREFFDDLFEDAAREERSRSDKYRRLRKFLVEHYGLRKRADLEEVMSYLHESQYSTLPIDMQRRTSLACVLEELNDYVVERLVRNPPGKQPEYDRNGSFEWEFDCCLHRRVFGLLRADSDSILNMNYDMIADGSLAKMTGWESVARNRTEGLSAAGLAAVHPDHPATKRASYIKLHGSLDSVTCLNPSCRGYHIISRRPKVGHWQGGTKGAVCEFCGALVALGIVPPVVPKSGREWSIGLDWSLAFYKLANSSRWILWGVSLAPSDHALRALLREAAQKRKKGRNAQGKHRDALELVVINPRKDAKELAEQVTQSTANHYTSARRWLKSRSQS